MWNSPTRKAGLKEAQAKVALRAQPVCVRGPQGYEGLLEGKGDAVENGCDEFFVRVTGKFRRGVDVVHDRLDAKGRLRVGGQYFFEAFTPDCETKGGFRARM